MLLAVQLVVVFAASALIAGTILAGAIQYFTHTTISVVLPGSVLALDLAVMALSSVLACVPSWWTVARAEPAEAFRT